MTLSDLAADAAFDPDDYHTAELERGCAARCRVNGCATRRVPVSTIAGRRVGVCGYCRARVKALRGVVTSGALVPPRAC